MKRFILFARLYMSLIFAFPATLSAQGVLAYPNYVVIGAFAHHKNAIAFTDDANKNQFPARFEMNPNRNLYYVYVLATDDRQFAIAEAVKLRDDTKYFDTWVYCGPLGDMVLANPGGQLEQDVDPVTGRVIELIPGETISNPADHIETHGPGDNEEPGADELSRSQETLSGDANRRSSRQKARRKNTNGEQGNEEENPKNINEVVEAEAEKNNSKSSGDDASPPEEGITDLANGTTGRSQQQSAQKTEQSSVAGIQQASTEKGKESSDLAGKNPERANGAVSALNPLAGEDAAVTGSEAGQNGLTNEQQTARGAEQQSQQKGKQSLVAGAQQTSTQKRKESSTLAGKKAEAANDGIRGSNQLTGDDAAIIGSEAGHTNPLTGADGAMHSPEAGEEELTPEQQATARAQQQSRQEGENTAGKVDTSNKAQSDPGLNPNLVAESENETAAKSDPAVVQGPPPKRASTAPLETKDVAGKNFYFHLFRADNGKMVAGEVDAIDFERARRMSTYAGNEPVTVRMPSGKTKQVSFLCQVFGYRKHQVEFDPGTPAEYLYLDDQGNLVVPFELVRLQKGDIAIMYNVFFFKDAAVMRPESRYEVNNLLELLNENPSYNIRIHGHTNGNASGKIIHMGAPENFYSLTGTTHGFGSARKLSEERALVIREFLISSGISADRMEVKAWGGKKPIHDKHAARAHENVRVEIEILSK